MMNLSRHKKVLNHPIVFHTFIVKFFLLKMWNSCLISQIKQIPALYFQIRKKIYGKYSVIETEIFISYLNPEFKEIIRYLTLIEFIDGKENNDKLKILFGELEKYYHYLNIQYLNNNTLNIQAINMDILYKFKRSNKEHILSNAKNVYNAKISELFSKYRFLQL